MRSKQLFLILCFLNISIVQAQNVEHPKLMEVTLPSPSASALTKFGDMPVGLSTGLPSINIPVYNYSDQRNGLSLSVSLDYHAGGIRVKDHASNVGLGWALNAGGAITRVVRGISDETQNVGFFDTNIPQTEYEGNPPFTGDGLRPFNNISAGVHDGQNDIFSFNFNGRSGQFSFGKNNDILLNVSEKLKITRQIGQVNGYNLINSITIIDEKGFTYVFAASEMMTSMGMTWPGSKRSTNAWYITEIISPTSNEKILFQYDNIAINNYLTGTSLSRYMNISYYKEYLSDGTSSQSLQGKRLKKVMFPNGVWIDLYYKSLQRTDLPGDYLLDKLTVTDGSNKHGVSLTQDYSLKKATLTKVTPFNGPNEIPDKPFILSYFTSGTSFPNMDTSTPDHWGYFLGSSSIGSFPREIFPNSIGGLFELPGSNRDTNPLYVKVGSLEKITYPTGGYTVFEMEANTANHDWLKQQFNVGGTTYSHIQNYVGGLRVKKISDYDGVSSIPVQVKEYEYLMADGLTSSGALGVYPTYSYYVSYDYNGTNNGDDGSYMGSVGFIVRSSSSVYEMIYGGGSVVTYERVVEKRTSNGQDNGKTISLFTANQPFIIHTFPIAPPEYKSFSSGLLKEEQVYNRDNVLIKKTVNEYKLILDPFWETRRENFRSIIIVPVKFRHVGATDETISPLNTPLYFKMRDYLPASGRSHLISSEETFYEPSGEYKRRNGYSYDLANFYKRTDTLIDSKGVNQVTRYLYPTDMVSANLDPNGVYQGMVNKNMILPIVEKIALKNNTQLLSIKTNYYQPSTGIYLPQTVVSKVNALAEDQRLLYAYDSKGRILTASLAGGPPTSYVWDYLGQFVIAEVKNAVQADIAYTGFEAEGKGNWSYSGSSFMDATSPVGRRRYTLLGGSLSKGGLTAAKKYLLVYWIQGIGQPLVAGGTIGSPVFLQSRNGWSQYQREVNGATTLTLSGGAVLDEVRLHPVDAQMTTYTYEPLVGMMSETDAGGRTIYYEYDDALRLKTIKDQDGNILKNHIYHYKP